MSSGSSAQSTLGYGPPSPTDPRGDDSGGQQPRHPVDHRRPDRPRGHRRRHAHRHSERCGRGRAASVPPKVAREPVVPDVLVAVYWGLTEPVTPFWTGGAPVDSGARRGGGRLRARAAGRGGQDGAPPARAGGARGCVRCGSRAVRPDERPRSVRPPVARRPGRSPSRRTCLRRRRPRRCRN